MLCPRKTKRDGSILKACPTDFEECAIVHSRATRVLVVSPLYTGADLLIGASDPKSGFYLAA
jgi:hypothetical protein